MKWCGFCRINNTLFYDEGKSHRQIGKRKVTKKLKKSSKKAFKAQQISSQRIAEKATHFKICKRSVNVLSRAMKKVYSSK